MSNRKRKQQSNEGKTLVPIEFQLSEMVFVKQKGYAPWPAVITAFHPEKRRYAKVEFFAWNQQWAYVSFDSISKLATGREMIQKCMKNNIKLQKAVKEMDFVLKVTQRLLHERLGSIGFSSQSCYQQYSLVSNDATVVREKSIDSESYPIAIAMNEKRTIPEGPALDPVQSSSIVTQSEDRKIRTRSQTKSLYSNFQPNSIKSKIVTAEQNNSSSTIHKGRKKPSMPTSINFARSQIRTRSQSRSQSTSAAADASRLVVKKIRRHEK